MSQESTVSGQTVPGCLWLFSVSFFLPSDIPYQYQLMNFHIARENLAGCVGLRRSNLKPSASQTPGK